MNFNHGHPLEYVVIEDFYTEDELVLIWRELEFLAPKLLGPSETRSAHEDGVYLKHNTGIFLDNVYLNRDVSDILKINRKLWSEEVLNYLETISPWWRLLRATNKDTTLLNYYNNNQYYKPHVDTAVISASSVLCKNENNFTGGEFVFPEYNITIPCKSNSIIIFPSVVQHGVTPIEVLDQSKESTGRYSIAQFCTFKE